MKQRGRRRGDGVEDGGGDGGKESAAAEEMPVESRTTAGVGAEAAASRCSCAPSDRARVFGGFGGAQVNLISCAAGLHLSL